jgi:hypothetical protein
MLNPTQETMAALKASLGKGADLRKNVTISSGLTFYDLQAPAKNLYPTITPLRNVIPRVRRPNPGDAAHWKQVTGLVGSGFDAMGWVPEGGRSGTMSYQTANKSLSYVTVGEEDNLTFEAEAAAEGFEDENAMVTFRLLQKMMRKEEIAILGGNAGGVQLGTPGTITMSASGSGSSLTTTTYYAKVVALTLEGWKNSSLTAGVATQKTITGADGGTFTLNGGSSIVSAEQSTSVTSGNTLFLSVPAIQGAVAYAWFVGTASGGETLQAISNINSVGITAIAAGRQAVTGVGLADNSANPNYAFDGLLTQGLNTSSLAYVNSLATGTAGTGTVLTASGKGSCSEIDTMLQTMWQNYNIGPTVMYMNAQQIKDVTTKVLTNSSGPLLRYDIAADGKQPYELTANGVISFYFNPFDPTGGYKIPVRIHPDVPPGTILAWAEKLPEWYQSNEVPNVAEMLTRRDYYRMDWPLRTRKREYGVYAEEVLAVYATFGLGVLTNIASG